MALEFHGIRFKTRPEAMAYQYRLKGYEEDWKNTHEQRVEYPDLSPRGAAGHGLRVIEVQLAPGDRVVFCSDGIIEAANGAGEPFGYERTEAVIRRGCMEGLSAEALLARIMAEVKGFRGETPQGDDQTVVVLKIEDQTAF